MITTAVLDLFPCSGFQQLPASANEAFSGSIGPHLSALSLHKRSETRTIGWVLAIVVHHVFCCKSQNESNISHEFQPRNSEKLSFSMSAMESHSPSTSEISSLTRSVMLLHRLMKRSFRDLALLVSLFWEKKLLSQFAKTESPPGMCRGLPEKS